MSDFLMYALVPIAVGAVAVVHRSQKLMRMRVLLQFLAIIVIMLTIWAIR
jgi:hypothetical protein